MKKSICIICAKEKDGLEIKEDRIIKGAKWIKKNILRAEPKNYRLVVCKEDFLIYKKKRDSYERKQMIYVTLGIIFLLLLLVFSNGRILGAILFGAAVTIFLYLITLLSYIPAIAVLTESKSNKSAKKQAKNP